MTARLARLLVAVTGCALAAACAGRLPPVPDVSSPRYPDFVVPSVPPALASDTAATRRHERGWRFLQANDLRNAEREFSAALTENTRFFPSNAGLGYVDLAQKDYRNALGHFDLALKQSAAYPSALVGRGDALLGLSRAADALTAFQAALAADPSLTVAAQRVQVLQLRTSQAEIAEARRAADAGRYADARQAYQRAIAASPDSAFLYRDLGAVERRQGDDKAAIETFRRAVAMDRTDARSLVQIGEILETQGDYDGAVQAYAQAAAIEPDEALTATLARARERASMALLPAEFGEIARTPRLTRGDLAALIGVHFPRLVEAQRSGETPVITDSRGHWAAAWILPVARAGLIEVNPNHTFQPRSPVRRLDLARAISRLLNLAAAARPALAARWQSPGPPGDQPAVPLRIADVPAGHLNYSDVAQVVAAGVMPLFDDATFRPAQIVSGEEALQVIDRVERLLGATGGPGGPHSGDRTR
jgi:tetratricopeptide (TPR) repeat protein